MPPPFPPTPPMKPPRVLHPSHSSYETSTRAPLLYSLPLRWSSSPKCTTAWPSRETPVLCAKAALQSASHTVGPTHMAGPRLLPLESVTTHPSHNHPGLAKSSREKETQVVLQGCCLPLNLECRAGMQGGGILPAKVALWKSRRSTELIRLSSVSWSDAWTKASRPHERQARRRPRGVEAGLAARSGLWLGLLPFLPLFCLP